MARAVQYCMDGKGVLAKRPTPLHKIRNGSSLSWAPGCSLVLDFTTVMVIVFMSHSAFLGYRHRIKGEDKVKYGSGMG